METQQTFQLFSQPRAASIPAEIACRYFALISATLCNRSTETSVVFTDTSASTHLEYAPRSVIKLKQIVDRGYR